MRKCESKDATQLDRILRQEPKRIGEDGFVVRYEDLLDGEVVVKWVPKELVKLGELNDHQRRIPAVGSLHHRNS